MEKESINFEEEPEKVPEKASDMELAVFLAKHIENPCEVEVEPGKRENIREFYLREAKNMISKMADLDAKKFLEFKIEEYEQKERP